MTIDVVTTNDRWAGFVLCGMAARAYRHSLQSDFSAAELGQF
jgi:hypothetical protein